MRVRLRARARVRAWVVARVRAQRQRTDTTDRHNEQMSVRITRGGGSSALVNAMSKSKIIKKLVQKGPATRFLSHLSPLLT